MTKCKDFADAFRAAYGEGRFSATEDILLNYIGELESDVNRLSEEVDRLAQESAWSTVFKVGDHVKVISEDHYRGCYGYVTSVMRNVDKRCIYRVRISFDTGDIYCLYQETELE